MPFGDNIVIAVIAVIECPSAKDTSGSDKGMNVLRLSQPGIERETGDWIVSCCT